MPISPGKSFGLKLYDFTSSWKVSFIVAEIRQHSMGHLPISFPTHPFTPKLGRHLIVHDGRQNTHGEKVWLMSRIASGTTFAGPECTDFLSNDPDLDQKSQNDFSWS
jgi:hypothetical protein